MTTARPDRPVRPPMYEIWLVQDDGMTEGPRFRLHGDAVRYIRDRAGIAQYAIRAPDGRWQRWDGTGLVGF